METNNIERIFFEAINKFKKYWYYNLILFIILIGLFIYLNDKMNEAYRRKAERYPLLADSIQINSQIIDFYIDRGTSYITTQDSLKFAILNSRNYQYETYSLLNLLQVGDSLSKSRFSDTLYVYRNERKYYFIIGEFINKDHR